MDSAGNKLLVKFRAKDIQYGVTRNTLKAMAEALNVSETRVIHLALSRFATEVLPAYEPDDGPLTLHAVAAIRRYASKSLPKGRLLSRQDLF